uniref:mS45 n=1 Tax=Polytomella magna TaxID=353565 RepID=UPI002240E4B8|nr:Chain BD, mS45 [Polytomella magna]8APN_BC Chain BC, mS45 [Polytomella magna]8APO_BD Chain BD, mS45 [Polytomella magna]
PSVNDLASLLSLSEQYRGADVLAEGAALPGTGFANARGTFLPHELPTAIEYLKELDPEAEMKLEQMEAMYKLLYSRNESEREVGRQMMYDLLKLSGHPFRELELCNWDYMAAFLDARVAGRVFHRGSGERLVHRTATFPAFEGYPLAEVDQTTEGEVSKLNREESKRQDNAMFQDFRKKLLFNLGMVGEQLWEPVQGVLSANLRSALDRPLVVYDITAATGETVYPPKFVAEVDGTRRALNEQERAYQAKRKPGPRLPYYMRRIARKEEL